MVVRSWKASTLRWRAKNRCRFGSASVFEKRLDLIPKHHDEIQRDLTAIKRIVTTSSNHLRFDADRTENSHADIYWATALADLAADSRRQSLDGYGVFGGTSGLRNFNGGGFLTCFDPKEKYVKQAKASGPGQHPQRASYTFGANLEIRNFASSRGGSIKYFGRQSPGDARLQP